MTDWNADSVRAAILAYDDFFGNHAHSLSVSPPHETLTITAKSLIERVHVPLGCRGGGNVAWRGVPAGGRLPILGAAAPEGAGN